jgi:hypothetical protein
MAAVRIPARRWLAAVVLALTGAVLAPQTAVAATPPIPVPADGTAYFGVHLDGDTPDAYVQRSGLAPAVYGTFAAVPFDTTTKQRLSTTIDQVRAQGGMLLLTLEPNGGLSRITTTAAQSIATTIAGWTGRGVPIFVRFAHEMNASWYPWGQQPSAYVAAFRRVADAVHRSAPGAAMVWSPNYAGGYPFAGGAYSIRRSSRDFAALDTDHDGSLGMADDPYAPYFPGDAAVDWVGLDLYHFGNAYPWGENEVPEPGKLLAQLHGTYTGANGNEGALPDFYATWAAGHGKPMMLAETGAMFNEAQAGAGASEEALKDAWLDQVYGSRADLPLVKLIGWFEVEKFEGAVSSRVDWRATVHPAVLSHLQGLVRNAAYRFAH